MLAVARSQTGFAGEPIHALEFTVNANNSIPCPPPFPISIPKPQNHNPLNPLPPPPIIIPATMGQQLSSFVGKAITHIKDKVISVARQIVAPVVTHVKDKIVSAARHIIAPAVTHVKDKIVSAARRVLPPIAAYVVNHPIRTAMHVLNAVVIMLPSLIFPPLLSLAGFTGAGIAGGECCSLV